MALRPDAARGYPGRTYKFYDGPAVLYPFGHGLSYTNFSYALAATAGAAVTIPVSAWEHCRTLTYKSGAAPSPPPACPALDAASHRCGEAVSFAVAVRNTGGVGGGHVVPVYTAPPAEVGDAPRKQLVAFRRVFVPAGAAVEVPFALNVCRDLAIVEETAYTVVPSGASAIIVGDDALALSFAVTINLAV